MKFIAIIMALFLFSGSIKACGVSDLCCSGDKLEISSNDCCKKSPDQDTESDTDTEDKSCCAKCVIQVPTIYSSSPELKVDIEKTSQNILFAIENLSYDFHDDVWQPPKNS